ncbi:MAG: hypothetical protein ACJ77Z_10115 [Thermoleophilaceae bacterium]
MNAPTPGTPRSRSTDAAIRRLRPAFIGGTALLVLLLVFFAYSLAHSQAQQRRDLEKRFKDRADVAAVVNESIFKLASSGAMAADASQFGAKTVPAAALEQRAAQNDQVYSQIVAADGTGLATTQAAPGRDPLGEPHVKKALTSGRTEYSSIMRGPGGIPIIETATAFKTPFGVRLDVTGVKAKPVADFLNAFLTKLPSVADAQSYVIDPSGKLIASPGSKIRPGAELPDRALAAAASKRDSGAYGDGRYFASAPIPSSPWRIVLSASEDSLYSTINGSERILPWVIFAAFVAAVAFGLFLLRRVLVANTELERAELSRRHALEINDNVVQRLVVAKYALDRGATEASQQKLAETLRETQQLVTSLLEQKDIAPGSLRRETPAGTEGPPAPPEQQPGART